MSINCKELKTIVKISQALEETSQKLKQQNKSSQELVATCSTDKIDSHPSSRSYDKKEKRVYFFRELPLIIGI